MSYYKNLLLFVLLNLLISPILWAKNDKTNDCERLHIQIGNASHSLCQLISSKVVHGKLMTSPPAVILPGYTERFDINQTLRGPEIKLEYSCNGQRITFVSRQNYCFLKAGQVNGTIFSADASIRATYTTENGSYYWSKPGLINWVLTLGDQVAP